MTDRIDQIASRIERALSGTFARPRAMTDPQAQERCRLLVKAADMALPRSATAEQVDTAISRAIDTLALDGATQWPSPKDMLDAVRRFAPEPIGRAQAHQTADTPDRRAAQSDRARTDNPDDEARAMAAAVAEVVRADSPGPAYVDRHSERGTVRSIASAYDFAWTQAVRLGLVTAAQVNAWAARHGYAISPLPIWAGGRIDRTPQQQEDAA